MRICIPVADAPQGGMYSFYRNFRAYLRARGMAVTDDLAGECDVLMANSWAIDHRLVARVKRRRPGTTVLHRVDGSATEYGREGTADVRQALVNLLADATVFQSSYGRAATRGRGIIGQDGPVIHNPVDIERFRPDGDRLALPGRVRLAHVAFSTNARKGSAAVYELARRRPDVTFVMVGCYDGAPRLDNLAQLGYVEWDRLPTVLRSCHALLTLSENETCSNVVLEALASGLPVLYRASGGTPELVAECGAAMDPGSFDRTLTWVMDRRPALADRARERAVERFSFDVVFPRYLATAAGASRRPLPGAAEYVRTLLRLRPSPDTVARWIAGRARRLRSARAG
jgi:glycosyltransferase involved in cell wall biosynthesis